MDDQEGVTASDYVNEDLGGATHPDSQITPEVAPTAERRPGVVSSPSLPRGGAGPSDVSGRGKGWKFWQREPAAKATIKTKTTGEKRPRASGGRRVSSAGTIEDVWSGLGGLAVRSGRHAPLGRLLQWQAPIAGEMLDDAVKGTVVDKVVLQPIARGRGKFDAVGALLGPPLIVLAIERNPGNAEVLLPMLRASIRSSLPLMVPAIKKVKAREAAAAEAARELFPDLPDGVDPVDEVIAMMFADWTPPEPPPAADYGVDDEPQPS